MRSRQAVSDMIRVIHLRRLFAFATLVVICFIGLGAQLYRIQVVKHGKYTDVVEGNTVRSYVKPQ
jgi:cell division protein FtsI/penicillin-binding protein 2